MTDRQWRTMLALSVAIALPAIFALSPLRDALTHAPVGTPLDLPFTYVLLAPLSALLDAISLLSVGQHIAFAVTILMTYGAVRCLRRIRGDAMSAMARGRMRGWRRGRVAGLYAGMVLLPRPMAALALKSADELAIDFHSHTNASHDGRRDFSLADNQSWHSDGGFNVAFVTDHASASWPPAAVNRSRLGVGRYGHVLRCRAQSGRLARSRPR